MDVIAAERGTTPMEAFVDLAVDSDLEMFFVQALANQDQDLVLQLLQHPRAIPTFSDSGAHVTQIMDSSLQTHLLGHWVRDRQEFTLEDAVHRITQLPAQAWGFDDRGVLAVGKAADVNVFDPETVSPDMPKLVHDLPGRSAPAAPDRHRLRRHRRQRRSDHRARQGDRCRAGPAAARSARPLSSTAERSRRVVQRAVGFVEDSAAFRLSRLPVTPGLGRLPT